MNKNFTSFVDHLKRAGKDFTVHLSKNSQIIFKDEVKTVFAKKPLNPRVFHVAKEIKKETEMFLHYNKDYFDKMDRGGIRYYNYNKFPKKLKRFYFIDISSAYITALKNKRIISVRMFDKINSLPKSDRLSSLGMLAFEPYEVVYKDGKRQSIKRLPNPHSPIFYYACALTQDLMEKIIRKLDEKYLFYWVDGIFFEDQSDYNLAKDILKSNGFKFRFGACYDLKTWDKGDFTKVSFWQNDKGELKKKIYSIPVYFEDYKKNKENYNHILNEDFESLLLNYKIKKGLIN